MSRLIDTDKALEWIDKKIQIDDFHARRRITIGIQNNGHAEITNIEELPKYTNSSQNLAII